MSRLRVSIFLQHTKCNYLSAANLRRHIATVYGILLVGVLRINNGLQLARQMHMVLASQ